MSKRLSITAFAALLGSLSLHAQNILVVSSRSNSIEEFGFMTATPVLKKPFSIQELDDFMGAFRRPASSRFG